MSYSSDTVLVAVQRMKREQGKPVGKFEAAPGWRIVDIKAMQRDEVLIVMVPA